MIGYDYLPNQATAERLLKRFGLEFTITRNDGSEAYDPVIDEYVSSEVTVQAFGAVFDYGVKDIDGTMIVKGDKKLLMSAIGQKKPKTNQTVIFDGNKYKIQEPIKELKPASTVVIFQCNLRN